MVNSGILYAITAGVSCITIYVIINRIISTDHKELIDRKLVALFRFLCLFCLVDMIWGLLSSRLLIKGQFLYTIFTYAFHLFASLSAFFWAGYVIHFVKVKSQYKIILNSCRGTVLAIQIMVLVANIWTKSFFYVDQLGYYHSYKLRNFMFVMQFLYYIALIAYSLVRVLRKKEDDDKINRYKSALAFSCVPLAFGFGQMLWADAPMYSMGFMLTAVLIYSMNISSEREEYLKTIYKDENDKLQEVVMGLANDYQAIYYIDLDTNNYEVLGESGKYKKEVASKLKYTRDFFYDTFKNIDGVVCEEDADIVRKNLSKDNIINELSTKKSFSFNYRLNINGTETYYLCKVTGVAGEVGKSDRIIIGVFDDDGRIRKEAEQRKLLEEALATAQNANKAKTTFLFNMSHDIRTPMNAIIGFTNLARKHLDDRKYLAECLDKVSVSGDHLLSLINDVLDMARIEAGRMHIAVGPESIVKRNDQIISIVKELAITKSIALTTEMIGVEKEWILSDALHLNQVILNILSNAINYTNPGGRVIYSLEEIPLDEDRVKLIFTIKDTGVGMSPEFLDRIYDEFERENNATASGVQGTGLGMSIVKRLVDLMGGTIDIQSTQGVGTTVTLTLEFDVTDPVEEENSENICELPAGRHVLLVDDNHLNRQIAVEILADLGIECDEACDGREAVEKLRASKPGDYDLVLMDVQMPSMNGYEATKEIRLLANSEIANIPIIAMTANAFDEDKKDALDAGMNAHLSKPIDISALVKTLKEFL